MKRWLSQWSVNEDEPTWPQVAVTGVLFVAAMVAIYGCVLLVAVAMDVPL